MTANDFLHAYARECGLPAAKLASIGIRAVPCHCGLPVCRGWRVAEPYPVKPETLTAVEDDHAERPYEV